jgi:hypothetical protein
MGVRDPLTGALSATAALACRNFLPQYLLFPYDNVLPCTKHWVYIYFH